MYTGAADTAADEEPQAAANDAAAAIDVAADEEPQVAAAAADKEPQVAANAADDAAAIDAAADLSDVEPEADAEPSLHVRMRPAAAVQRTGCPRCRYGRRGCITCRSWATHGQRGRFFGPDGEVYWHQ